MPTTKKQRFGYDWDNYCDFHHRQPDKYVQTSTVADFDGSLITTMFLADKKHK